MFMLVFSLGSLLVGILTVYFASGKTRKVGIVFIILGLIVGILFLWFSWILPFLGQPPLEFVGCILNGISAVIGALFGIAICLGFFLLTILKI
jgi:hypothetical protein